MQPLERSEAVFFIRKSMPYATKPDMGTKYQEFNSLTQTFPDNDRLTDQQKENRKILCRSMQRAGFVNYFPEWWHYSYGEIEWAVITHTGKTLYLPLNI